MKNYTIEELMSALGCEKWPERWKEFYSEVVSDLASHGNELADPEYYEQLSQKYDVLVDHKEIYKQAAREIAENEELSLFFALLLRALKDRKTIMSDIARLSMPKAPEGRSAVGYDMLPALAMCQSIPAFYDSMKARGIPDDIIYPSLRIAEGSVAVYIKKHNGNPGYGNFDWFQLAYDGKLFRIGNLQLEFPAGFPGIAMVLENEKGEQITLATNVKLHRDGFPLGSVNFEDEEGAWTATVEETDTEYIGYPYNDRGWVSHDRITLSKSEWKVVFKGGDRMVSLHIPAGVGFGNDAVEETLRMSREFIEKYFPEYDYKAFFCGSWLLDRQLVDILGEEANISKYCKRFTPLAVKSGGKSVFTFVFNKPDQNFEISELPENTRLERALKAHYLSGGAIYETFGFFMK